MRASISQSSGVAAWMQGPGPSCVPDLQRAVLPSPMAGQTHASCVHAEVVREHLSLLPAGQQCLGLHSVSGWTHATVITHHPRADTRQPGMVQLTVTQQASPSVILSHLSLHCHLSYSCFSFPSFSPSPQGLKIGLEKENLETYDPKYAFYPNFLMDLLGNGSYFTKS